MKKQNKATKQNAKKSTKAKNNSAVSKSAKKKSESMSQRYSAKLVNGKGYIFDKNFSEKIPIAVETTMEFAEKQVEKFNKEEKSAGKNSTKKTAVTKKKETAATKSATPKKEPKITVKAIRTHRGVFDYPVVDELPQGWKRNEKTSTEPVGYVWVTNGESLFNGKRKKALMKEEDYKASLQKSVQNAENTKQAKPSASKPAAKPAPSKQASAPQAKPFKVWSGGNGKRFATLKEATDFANAIQKKTGCIVAVTEETPKQASKPAAQPAPKAEQPAAKRRVYKSMPNNYSVVKGSVAQEDGTILIHNGKPLFKQNKDGTTEQVKDSHGKPAHKFASLIVDQQAFNEAQKKSRVGEIHRGNTKYIDKEPKPQRNFAVVKDKDGNVTVAKVKTIKEFDENGKNADPHLVEIDHKKYGLEKPSGVDHETFRKNRMSNKPLRLEDKDVFPEQEPRAKLNSKDKHNVLIHTKVINPPKNKKGGKS